MKRIALWIRDDRLAELCRLEIESLGFVCVRLGRAEEIENGYEGLLCELPLTREAEPFSSFEGLCVGIGGDADEGASIYLPAHAERLASFSLEILRRFLCGTSTPSSAREDRGMILLRDGKRGVLAGSASIRLSRREMLLLECLCAERGRVVSRERLRCLLGDKDSNMTEVYICRLRKKLEEKTGRRGIRTLRGEGYLTDYSLL